MSQFENRSCLTGGHRQAWVKVNAHVDAGIADLVLALAEFPQLQTLESCQGTPPAGSWVCFRYGEDNQDAWRELADFVLGYFGPGLAKEIGDLATVSVVISSCGLAQAEIAMHPESMTRVVEAVRKLARDFNAGDHTCACFCDK